MQRDGETCVKFWMIGALHGTSNSLALLIFGLFGVLFAELVLVSPGMDKAAVARVASLRAKKPSASQRG